MPNHTPFQLPERFWAKTRRDPSGCLIWTGAHNSKGYGLFSLGGKLFLAHRLSHLAELGPIEDGLQVDHLCRVRDCVEPLHLEAVTAAENNRRRMAAMAERPPKERKPRTSRPRKIAPPPVQRAPYRYPSVTHQYVHPVSGWCEATHVDLPFMRRRCPNCPDKAA